jgi:hypothetical protein
MRTQPRPLHVLLGRIEEVDPDGGIGFVERVEERIESSAGCSGPTAQQG